MEKGETSPDTDVEAMSILNFALGEGPIARLADDPDFDFDRYFKIFESKIRGLLK